MRLRTYESFWLLTNGLLHSYPSLHGHHETGDVAVIGGGITGALISHALMEKGYSVVLLDKRDIANGSTSATTSMLQYEIDVPLYQLSEMIGEEAAVLCYKSGLEAIHKLGELIDTHRLDCGFERKQSLYLAREKKQVAWLKQEFDIRDKHALQVSWLSAEEIKKEYGIKCFGGILSEVAASVDAYRLAHELIAFNAARGMKVYDQTVISKTEYTSDGCLIVTEEGSTVQCKKIVYCTGYEATELLKEKTADVFYTYACVSEQEIAIPEKLKKTLVWDTGSPYLYMRSTDDGRFLIGGEDALTGHSFFQNKIKERKSQKLQKMLAKAMPGIQFIEDFSWAGIFGTTKDGLPYIGESPEFPGALFVLGYGGNGITFSVQGMEIITDLLEGKENELAHWYRFGR
jgi:glycine/D-amino acid oxidase-like deaminating enzyme